MIGLVLCLSYATSFFSVILLDRITKALALSDYFSDLNIGNLISFDVVFNRGISWGFFDSASSIVFACVNVVIAVAMALLCWYAYTRARDGLTIFGEVMVVAGAVSNMIDRVMYGAVVDFIVFQIGSWSWPVFNIADSFVVVGVFLMLFTGMHDKNSSHP